MNKNICLSGLKKDRPDGMIRQREDLDNNMNNTPSKVTTKTFREDNGDRIVTVTQRHATMNKPGRIVTTITTGIRSGNVKSETLEEIIHPLTHIESTSAIETSQLEDQGNEAFRQQVLGKINKQLFANSQKIVVHHKEYIGVADDRQTISTPALPLNARLNLNNLLEEGTLVTTAAPGLALGEITKTTNN
jgi:hypothetical protein